VNDVPCPDAVHLAFVRSTHAHATLKAVDASAALALPGVSAVLTAADFGTHFMPDINPLLPVTADIRFPLLATESLDNVGQPLAIVLATSHAIAAHAAGLVAFDIDELAPVQDFDSLQPETRVQHKAGMAPAGAAHRVQANIDSARVTAMAMEPRGCLASWDNVASSITIWRGTQTPARAQADYAHALRLPLEKVRVISPDVGGAFGFRASVYPEDLLTALAAQHIRGSVRWASSRSEDFVAGMHGRGSRMQGELALDDAGNFLALKARLAFTHGAWLPYSGVVPLRNTARILPGPYRVSTLDIEGQASRSHAAPVNIYRGAGRPEAALLMETLVDMAARACGLDPVELRRRNLIAADDMPYQTPTGETLDSGDYALALNRACERFGYDTERQRQQQRIANGELVGIGVGLYIEPCGQGWETARVTLEANGKVRIASGAPAQGQGHATTFAQLAASELGCEVADVTVFLGDTAQCPPGIGALASRSIAIGGSAIASACRDVVQRVRDGAGYPVTADAKYTAAEAWSYGCVIARLSIDRDTGEPHVERLVWVDDAGTIINPALVHGQLIGGAAQGMGQALMERLLYDATGQLVTGSLMDYAVPRAQDMPTIEIESLHTPSPNNLLGAKGVGEAGCIGVPAALMNAARDALRSFGEPDLHLPLTAEQLWRAMKPSP
jgi:carbon-monoxide dehydrogenase large subunit